MRAGLMRRPPGDPLKASVQRGHHHEDVNPSSGQMKLQPRLGQSVPYRGWKMMSLCLWIGHSVASGDPRPLQNGRQLVLRLH